MARPGRRRVHASLFSCTLLGAHYCMLYGLIRLIRFKKSLARLCPLRLYFLESEKGPVVDAAMRIHHQTLNEYIPSLRFVGAFSLKPVDTQFNSILL
jgi:hypothetical protein